MNERDFELLSALNQTKNITRAADLLYITQSALSKRINALEEELGATLMLRSRQGIHFTPEGEEVLERTQAAAEQLTLMRRNLDQSKSYISGTLNAGISINYGLYTLPDVLAEYRQRYPHVNTHIITDQSRNLYQMMMNGKVDVAIVRGEYPWQESKILLSRENICAICSSSDAGKSLKELPYIGRSTDIVLEREIAQWMRENEIHPSRQGIFVNSIVTCMEMVERGLGWGIVPELCLKNFSGHVQPLIFKNGEPFVRSTYLIYSNAVASLPQAQAFIHFVKNHGR